MKIMVLMQCRTRSSYLINSACKYYNIKNFFEYYQSAIAGFQSSAGARQNLWGDFSKYLTTSNDNIHKIDHGIKILPSHFVNGHELGQSNYTKIKEVLIDRPENFIHNAVDIIRIKDYDKVYITSRTSFAEMLCSTYTAHVNSSYFFYDKFDRKRFPYKQLTLEVLKDHRFLKSIMFNQVLLDKIEQSLIRRNIPYKKLDYNEIPEYVQNNYPNVKANLVETEIDYKALTPEFDAIENWAQQCYSELTELSRGIEFL